MAGSFAIRDKELRDTVFGIVGLGLIGGSYAKALRRLGVKKIIAVEKHSDTLSQALKEGVIDVACQAGDESLKEADAVIFAVYPAAMLAFIRKYAAFLRQGALVTDVAGVKGALTAEAAAILGPGIDFVSGHPMAGREGSGFMNSAAEIFDGANYIVLPSPANRPENILWLKKLALSFGCRSVVELSPEKHDEIIAYTSNLPHLLAVSLMNSPSLSEDTKFFIAGSFRDATRVADINAELWADLFLGNKYNVLAEIGRFEQELARWSEALQSEDRAALLAMMQSAAQKRKALKNA